METIKKRLDDMNKVNTIPFDQLLLDINMKEENYLLAISSSLNTPTGFYKENQTKGV